MFFRDIIGQLRVKEKLLSGVREGRVAHAQLFLGLPGSGGLALAAAYAQYISCTNRLTDDSCGECPSCIKYNKLVHPDLHFVFPIALSKDVRVSANVINEFREAFLNDSYITLENWIGKLEAENKQAVIGTEESGDILRTLSLTTFESPYKIMIIWMAEKMNVTAANKLLKILEEPPDRTIFLLVTENESELLRTIVSRTQLVKLERLADSDIASALVTRFGIQQADAEKIAYQSDGSFAEARQLIERNEQAAFNLSVFQKWMRCSLKFDAPKVIECVDELSSIGRERQKQFFSYALGIVRECLIMNYGRPELVRLSGEELAFVTKFSAFVHGANGERFMKELNRASLHIERNGSPKIILLDLSFKMNELLNIPKVSA